jgi:hypothetical protein
LFLYFIYLFLGFVISRIIVDLAVDKMCALLWLQTQSHVMRREMNSLRNSVEDVEQIIRSQQNSARTDTSRHSDKHRSEFITHVIPTHPSFGVW